MKVIGFGDSILKGAVLTGGPTLKYSLLQAGFLEQVCSGKGLETANHARFGSTITESAAASSTVFSIPSGRAMSWSSNSAATIRRQRLRLSLGENRSRCRLSQRAFHAYGRISFRICRNDPPLPRKRRPPGDDVPSPAGCGQVLPPRNAGVGSCGQGERSQMDERKDGFHQ